MIKIKTWNDSLRYVCYVVSLVWLYDNSLWLNDVIWRQWTESPSIQVMNCHHYNDVIMTTMASQITSLMVVYSNVYSDPDQRKHQSSASLAFVWGIHRDRWIPRTKGQLRGKCFHLMTSSCLLSDKPLSEPRNQGCLFVNGGFRTNDSKILMKYANCHPRGYI